MPKLIWVASCGFYSKFHTLSSRAKFWKSVKIWQSYRQLNGGNFFETQCISGKASKVTWIFCDICTIRRHSSSIELHMRACRVETGGCTRRWPSVYALFSRDGKLNQLEELIERPEMVPPNPAWICNGGWSLWQLSFRFACDSKHRKGTALLNFPRLS